MKWVIVVVFLMPPGEYYQDLYAFMEYPFPDIVSCKAFAEMNYDLSVNIALDELGKTKDQVQDVFCAPAHELLEMKNGQSI